MTSAEKRWGAMTVLAAAITEAGRLEGRVRLQKLMYLLKRAGVAELSRIEFMYHHYGPYSGDVAETLRQAVVAGICRERADRFDDEWQKYTYEPGGDAQDAADGLSARSRAVLGEVVRRCKAEHWRTLELAATIDFLMSEEHLSGDAAATRAIELKPACQPFSQAALVLLSDLPAATPA